MGPPARVSETVMAAFGSAPKFRFAMGKFCGVKVPERAGTIDILGTRVIDPSKSPPISPDSVLMIAGGIL